jgi:hypothetical protein
MESSLFSITYSIFGMLDFCNKNQIKENQGDKRRERERKKREKRKSYLRGFLFCAVMA